MQVKSITNAVAYLISTPDFKSKEAKQVVLREEDDFALAYYPSEVYLTIVADGSGRAAEYAF